MKQKNHVLLFFIAVFLSVIILFSFVTGYYSIDTERIYTQGYIDYATKDAYIRDGRLISAFIFVIVGIINPSIKTMHIISIVISIIILSICVIFIYDIIQKYKTLTKKKSKIIAFLLSYTYIFNFLIVDVLKFIDSFVISISILLFLLAIKKIIIDKKYKVGFLLTVFGVICYQGTIPVYIATAFLVTLLENKQINKTFFKKIVPCAICICIAAMISLIIVNSIPVITGMEKTDRMDGIDYIKNIKKNMLEMNKLIFFSYYMFPPYVWIGISTVIIIMVIIYGFRYKKIYFSVNSIILFTVYIFSVFIMLPIQILSNAPRVTLAVGQGISAILIYSYCTNFKNVNKKRKNKKIMVMILILYFVITLVSIFKSTYAYKLGNILDQKFAEAIENEITKLEQQGITINAIGIRYTYNNKNIQKYGKLVKEQSLYIRGLYTARVSKFYTGRNLTMAQGFTEEIEEKYFENPSEKEVQFKNLDDVLYILIDL